MKIDNDFVMTLESLSDISCRNLQNWEGQRPINEDRVNELEASLMSLLTDKYFNFVKPDKRIYRPNINIDCFKSELINSNIIDKYKINHPDVLLDLFDQLQHKYKSLSDKELSLKLSCKL